MANDEDKSKPGLFEFLDEGDMITYDPTEKVDYVLSHEEYEMFDKMEGSEEEKRLARKAYINLHGKVSPLDNMGRLFKDIWSDKLK